MLKILAAALGAALLLAGPAAAETVRALKVTVLSTMLADQGVGEWGYAALVEVDGRRFLFDTGLNPDTVLRNAKSLKIDLSTVEDVIISHNHGDHTGGLVALRRELMKTNPHALERAHAAAGIFLPRYDAAGVDQNGLTLERTAYEKLGGRFVLHGEPTELAPGVWFTGPVPRRNPETNWSEDGLKLRTAAGSATDNIPEDAALVFVSGEGAVVLTGCGHAGIVNIAEDAHALAAGAPVVAVIGGLHLFEKSEAVIDWTGAELKRLGVRYLLAGHCTGIEATMRLRRDLGLDRRTAPVSSVGSSFTLGAGIHAGDIAA